MHYIFILFLTFFPVIAMAQDTTPIEITADEELEWDRDAMTFIARGNATITQGKTTLTAKTLTAKYFEDNGNTIIETVTATGNRPTIKTDAETLIADKAVATFSNQKDGGLDKITATGNVHIKRNNNILTGERAEFDVKTNTSTMTSTGTGRVKAIFYTNTKND